MRFVTATVEPVLQTPGHPSFKSWHRSVDRLQDYLNEEFDPDGVLDVPEGSCEVVLSATFKRCSRFKYLCLAHLGRIELDLQPAYDVADMVQYFSVSRIWPVRIVYRIFAILREMLYAHDRMEAGAFVDAFCARHLRQMINERRIAQPDAFPDLCHSRMLGFDREALLEQLVAFQTFHEIGHLIGFRNEDRRGERFSVERADDELYCDDFACSEVLEFCEGEDIGGFFQSSEVSVFLSILIWTLAGQLRVLDNEGTRRAIFSTLLQRSRAAAVHLYRRYRHFDSETERLATDAQRYFPLFEEILEIVEAFFLKGCSSTAGLFEKADKDEEHKASLLWGQKSQPAVFVAESGKQFAWENIWDEEDDAAERRYQEIKSLYERYPRRPRSRMAFSVPRDSAE